MYSPLGRFLFFPQVPEGEWCLTSAFHNPPYKKKKKSNRVKDCSVEDFVLCASGDRNNYCLPQHARENEAIHRIKEQCLIEYLR